MLQSPLLYAAALMVELRVSPGDRKNGVRYPVVAWISAVVEAISEAILEGPYWCVIEWLPMVCPLSMTSRAIAGKDLMFSPISKKVALHP